MTKPNVTTMLPQRSTVLSILAGLLTATLINGFVYWYGEANYVSGAYRLTWVLLHRDQVAATQANYDGYVKQWRVAGESTSHPTEPRAQ